MAPKVLVGMAPGIIGQCMVIVAGETYMRRNDYMDFAGSRFDSGHTSVYLTVSVKTTRNRGFWPLFRLRVG